jgi:Nitrous oxide-stimulated promoter
MTAGDPHADAAATTAQAGVSRAAAAAAQRAARLATPRLTRELDTIAAMLHIWCRDHHGGVGRDGAPLCADCARLLAYARQRLAACPYGPEKPTCTRCPIHCYGKRQRDEVKTVMRYAGPRMLTRHPWLALAHLRDGWRPVPPRPAARPAGADRPPGAPPDTPSG